MEEASVAEITQAEREAIHARHYGLSRDGLSSAAQVEYDRLSREPDSPERWKIAPPLEPLPTAYENRTG
jgi:hypothetical protein